MYNVKLRRVTLADLTSEARLMSFCLLFTNFFIQRKLKCKQRYQENLSGVQSWLLCLQTEDSANKKDSSVQSNQWFDVAVVKATNMLVTHYYVPLDNNSQTNGAEASNVSQHSM